MTRIESMFAINPNKDIIEDNPLQEKFVLKNSLIVLTRIRIVIYYLTWLLKIDSFIHHNWYPTFTKFAYLCLMAVLYFFEPRYIISYLVLILFVVVLTHSKFYETYLMPLFNKWFFSEKHLHALLQNRNKIQ